MEPEQDMPELQKIAPLLKQRVGAYLVVLFGSFARGPIRSDSDIDVAFAGDTAITGYELFLLSQELAAMFGREVDLLDLNRVSTVMKAQIVATGKVLFCEDESKRQYLYMRALRDYASLNEERAEVLNSVAKRGAVYA